MPSKIIVYFTICIISLLYLGCKEKPEQMEAAPTFRDQIGLQLYSLRNQTVGNLDSALQYVKDEGITDIELAGFANLKPEEF
ncbi:MAG TPA: hypothetical protein PKD85_14490, partial [Saprospiraceae bacterium]|nr:hypothetical protein [Saprospiraceae bacterium]